MFLGRQHVDCLLDFWKLNNHVRLTLGILFNVWCLFRSLSHGFHGSNARLIQTNPDIWDADIRYFLFYYPVEDRIENHSKIITNDYQLLRKETFIYFRGKGKAEEKWLCLSVMEPIIELPISSQLTRFFHTQESNFMICHVPHTKNPCSNKVKVLKD